MITLKTYNLIKKAAESKNSSELLKIRNNLVDGCDEQMRVDSLIERIKDIEGQKMMIDACLLSLKEKKC